MSDKSLNTVLAPYARKGPITVCFAPGTYTLSEPLVLDATFANITLESCGGPVVFQAAGARDRFLRGLIVVDGTHAVTIRGIEFRQPLTAFTPPQNAFAALSVATRNNVNQSTLEQFTREMAVAIGITAQDAQGLTVKDCTFVLNVPEGTLQRNVFGAAIYATGSLADATISGCSFRTFPAPETVPFYDLAAGHEPPFPWLLSFGYLQVPVLPPGNRDVQNIDLGLFHDAIIDHCRFLGLTVPVLVEGRLGTIRVDANTVQDCYGGIWLAALADAALTTGLSLLPIGNAAIHREMSSVGLAPYADPVMRLAILVAQVLPTGSENRGRVIPALTDQTLTQASQALSRLLTRAARIPLEQLPQRVITQPGRETPSEPAAGPRAVTSPSPTALRDILTHLPRLDEVLTNLGARRHDFSAEEDTGTAAVLRLTVTGAQVDALVSQSYSGVGLMVGDQTSSPGSAVLTGNRIRNRCPSGLTTAVIGAGDVTVTSNIFINEVSPNPSNHSFSLVPRANLPTPSEHADPALSGSYNYVLPHGRLANSSNQSDWRWCNKCQGLFFSTSGVCPAGGSHADPTVSGSLNYVLPHDTDGDQSGWHFCSKCQGLFFGDSGVCPAGGTHSDPATSGSYNYVLPHETDRGGQPGWRFCSKCQGLFYGASATRGVCPATPTYTAPVAIVGNVFVSAPLLPDRPGQLPSWGTLNTEVEFSGA